MVFFSGMPSDAAGPVAETVTPIFTSAKACVLISADALVATNAAQSSAKPTSLLLPRNLTLRHAVEFDRVLIADQAVGEWRV